MNIRVQVIKDFMQKYHIKQYTLGLICNLSRQSVKNILNNSKHSKIEALKKIANFMEIDVNELIIKSD